MRIWILTLFLASVAKASIVTDEFVTKVGIIESNLNYKAIGDGSKARGAWQMWSIAWSEVSRLRKLRGEVAYNYNEYSTDPKISRIYATEYLKWCESQFLRKTGRQPNHGEIYFVFNAGIGRVVQLGFNLSNAPAITQRACVKLARL